MISKILICIPTLYTGSGIKIPQVRFTSRINSRSPALKGPHVSLSSQATQC